MCLEASGKELCCNFSSFRTSQGYHGHLDSLKLCESSTHCCVLLRAAVTFSGQGRLFLSCEVGVEPGGSSVQLHCRSKGGQHRVLGWGQPRDAEPGGIPVPKLSHTDFFALNASAASSVILKILPFQERK